MNLNTTITVAMNWMDRIAAVLLATITLLVFADAILRYLFTLPLPDAFDVSRLLLGCALLWGLAGVCYKDAHIRVDLFRDILPPRGRWLLDLFATAVTFVAVATFAWMLLAKVQEVFHAQEETFDLAMPIWPFYAVAWLGVVAATLSSLARVFLTALQPLERGKQSAKAESTRAAEEVRYVE